MAKYSMKRDGKEVGPAEVYAEPHTMSGKKVTVAGAIKDTSGAKVMDGLDISVGNISKNLGKPTKTDGIKIRGTGAATKGVMARGPMA
jgi:formylmethanofuran dehydrogenase subunit C